MVESFGVGQDGGGESAVSLWSGVVASAFFLAQFLTALLWVSVANKHGRRIVLFASLVGNGLTVIMFGASKNLGSAITTRLALGLFNGEQCISSRTEQSNRSDIPVTCLGAVGVARSAVTDVTDDTNRPLAYTLVGEPSFFSLIEGFSDRTKRRGLFRSSMGSRRYRRKCSRRSS